MEEAVQAGERKGRSGKSNNIRRKSRRDRPKDAYNIKGKHDGQTEGKERKKERREELGRINTRVDRQTQTRIT